MFVCRYWVLMLMFFFVNVWFIWVRIFGWFLCMWSRCEWLVCFGSDILGKLMVDSVELLLLYFVSLFVILILIFFCVFCVLLFICGVRMILLNVWSGDLNFLVLDLGLIGNILIVVLFSWLFFNVFVSVLIFIIVLWDVLIKMLFFFIWDSFFLLIIFWVCGVLGMWSEIMLEVLSSFLSDFIWVELFSISLFLILKNWMCIFRCLVRIFSCVFIWL